MEHNQIIILKQNDYFRTSGCKSFLSFELQVVAKGIDELSFRVLINYLITLSKKHKISNNQTIAYYSWILKFIELENGVFEVFELNPQTKNYIKGIFFSNELLIKQQKLCLKYNVVCDFPHFGEMIAVSIGFESNKLSCERHEREINDCGWYVTSDLFDGNHKSMNLIHFSHFAILHYNILEYFALPSGFILNFDNNKIDIHKFE